MTTVFPDPATLNFAKLAGLIPAIVQHATTGRVLMLGFMNREAFEESKARNKVVFWSRSKDRLWQKGETSGNILNIVSVTADCDYDTLLILAEPEGPVCHLGTETCFQGTGGEPPAGTEVLEGLFRLIRERKLRMPGDSYTSELFRGGVSRIAQKVGEEAVELAIAAQHEDRQRCVEEAADLIYHLFVLLAEKEISISDVTDELAKRRR
jgi:phosphoribosyl-ATP pyrophosphohydrolase/phosphoribosyl-AMP cyclohydrolase